MKKLKQTCALVTLMATIAMGDKLQAELNTLDGGTTVVVQDSGCLPFCNSNPGRFYFEADLLYWKPSLSGLELDFGTNTISQAVVDEVEVITTTEYDADPRFKWNAGYRLGAGYQFACSNWGVGAVWTHFQDTGTRTVTEDAITENSTRMHLKFNQFDVLAVYSDNQNNNINLRPFFGVRGATIRHGVDAFIVTDITIEPDTLATETRTFDDNQSYWGVGPLIGLQADWGFGCGFSLYGNAAASLLYGKYKLSFDDTDILSAPFSRETFSTSTRRLHSFDWNIDLAVGVRWETCLCDCYQLSFKLGFEHHQYFNQGRLSANRGDLAFDGGVFSVGLAL